MWHDENEPDKIISYPISVIFLKGTIRMPSLNKPSQLDFHKT